MRLREDILVGVDIMKKYSHWCERISPHYYPVLPREGRLPVVEHATVSATDIHQTQHGPR